MKKHVVVVSRKWDNPNIDIQVTDEQITVAMLASDFVVALAREVGNPATMLTEAQLLKRLQAAAQAVVDGMKQETTRVM